MKKNRIKIYHSSIKTAWSLNDVLHRDDGPAVIFNTGREEWYQHGKLHRNNGPAVIDKRVPNNFQIYYQNGICHRDDGPAVISFTQKIYFVKGRLYAYHPYGYQGKPRLRFWVFNGEDKSEEVEEWLKENNIKYTFSENDLILFNLVWS